MLEAADLVAFVGVSDLEVAKEFYGETLGLRLTDESPFALVGETDGTILRITVVGEPARAPYTVLGWTVADIESTVEELTGRGVRFSRYDGMDQSPGGVWTAPGGSKVAWFLDPDANVLSLSQLADG
jgi:catechol 2,3-dioxygenase-like lactoylglutathione lyase family enzyme